MMTVVCLNSCLVYFYIRCKFAVDGNSYMISYILSMIQQQKYMFNRLCMNLHSLKTNVLLDYIMIVDWVYTTWGTVCTSWHSENQSKEAFWIFQTMHRHWDIFCLWQNGPPDPFLINFWNSFMCCTTMHIMDTTAPFLAQPSIPSHSNLRKSGSNQIVVQLFHLILWYQHYQSSPNIHA